MLLTLKYFGKCFKQAKMTHRYTPKPQYFGTTIWLRNNDPPLPPMTVTDINADEMMDADEDFASDFEYRHREPNGDGTGIIKPGTGSGSDGRGIVGTDGHPVSPSATKTQSATSSTNSLNASTSTITSTTAAPSTSTIKTTNLFGAPLAPVDINGWDDEEEFKECTVEYEDIEKYRETVNYPPVPETRAGTYEFHGIKISLPKSWATKGTYRYRITPEDEAVLADDTRICRFEPKTSAKQGQNTKGSVSMAAEFH